MVNGGDENLCVVEIQSRVVHKDYILDSWVYHYLSHANNNTIYFHLLFFDSARTIHSLLSFMIKFVFVLGAHDKKNS